MKNNIYGYVRVSSKDQNVDRQMAALREWGVQDNKIFKDWVSGKNFDRPQYIRLMKKLRRGDTLVVKSIDRLGRNYEEVLAQWRHITKEVRADIVVLDMPLLDTRQGKDLVGTLIADIVLELLSYVAQTERELIRQRQSEGITAAKARGVKFGRKPLERPDNYPAVYSAWKNEGLSARKAANLLGISHTTFLRWAKLPL